MASRARRIRVWVLVGVLLALAAVAVYSNVSYRRLSNLEPVTRKPSDFIVSWRCLACGQESEDNAGPGPKTCPKCGKSEFYTCIRFSCPSHGVFPVAFNYDQNGRPNKVKVGDGPWVPYIDEVSMTSGILCPTCHHSLAPAEAPRQRPDTSGNP